MKKFVLRFVLLALAATTLAACGDDEERTSYSRPAAVGRAPYSSEAQEANTPVAGGGSAAQTANTPTAGY